MEGQLIQYSMSFFIIFVSCVECVVLHYTNTIKAALVVFQGNKFLACLLAGLVLLIRTVCTTLEINTVDGCIAIISGINAILASYITHTLLTYVDLYTSLKSMAINDPVITKTKAILLSLLTWTIWITVHALAFIFEHPEWHGKSIDECRREYMFLSTWYGIALLCLRGVLLVALLVMLFVTSRLLQKSIRNHSLHNDNPGASPTMTPMTAVSTISKVKDADGCKTHVDVAKRAKYIEVRKRVLHVLAIKTWIMVICWGLGVNYELTTQMCALCRTLVPVWLNDVIQILTLLPIITNGAIHLFFHQNFRKACVRFCCQRRSVE
jgi:hypothetical protein